MVGAKKSSKDLQYMAKRTNQLFFYNIAGENAHQKTQIFSGTVIS